MQTENPKENRSYIVWSIIMGILLGFIINVFSSVYYGLFIVKETTWSQLDHTQLVWCALAFVALIGYLQFFVADYPNTFEFSKAYWKRYRDHFFYKFWPGKIFRWIIGFYVILFLVALMIGWYYLMATSIGYGCASIVIILFTIMAFYRERLKVD